MFEFLKAIWKKQPGTDRGRQRAAFAEFGKGLACFSPSQREQALRHFRTAIALKPDEGVFHLRIAATLEALGQIEEALREYHEAIRLMPGEGGPFLCLGNLARSRGDTAGARENYAKASAPLIEALKDRAGRVRSAAAAALGRFGPQAVEPLIRTLGDEYFFARAHAAESLGTIGNARAVAPLTSAAQDKHSRVREAAAAALESIRRQSGLPKATPSRSETATHLEILAYWPTVWKVAGPACWRSAP